MCATCIDLLCQQTVALVSKLRSVPCSEICTKLLFIVSDLPEPMWIGGQSKPNEKWVYYGTDKPIPLPTEGVASFPPWLCLGKPTYTSFLSVASWGYGWRVYEGQAAEKFVICAEVPGMTTTTKTTTTTTTTTTPKTTTTVGTRPTSTVSLQTMETEWTEPGQFTVSKPKPAFNISTTESTSTVRPTTKSTATTGELSFAEMTDDWTQWMLVLVICVSMSKQ
jgi:hypothetical protein